MQGGRGGGAGQKGAPCLKIPGYGAGEVMVGQSCTSQLSEVQTLLLLKGSSYQGVHKQKCHILTRFLKLFKWKLACHQLINLIFLKNQMGQNSDPDRLVYSLASPTVISGSSIPCLAEVFYVLNVDAMSHNEQTERVSTRVQHSNAQHCLAPVPTQLIFTC